ncbi:hypothetical protein IU487_33380 [Nocardia puris]|nr:hypothetical protein [Nocardia puris]MBF6215892.1 hypothetical protein [Nocardia puris]
MPTARTIWSVFDGELSESDVAYSEPVGVLAQMRDVCYREMLAVDGIERGWPGVAEAADAVFADTERDLTTLVERFDRYVAGMIRALAVDTPHAARHHVGLGTEVLRHVRDYTRAVAPGDRLRIGNPRASVLLEQAVRYDRLLDAIVSGRLRPPRCPAHVVGGYGSPPQRARVAAETSA